MPRVRVPVRRTGYRTTVRPGRRYPPLPPPPARGGRSLAGIIGGLGGLLLCLLCLATMGLLGLFASFIAVTAYLGDIYRAIRDLNSSSAALSMNSLILLVALCVAGICKLRRAI